MLRFSVWGYEGNFHLGQFASSLLEGTPASVLMFLHSLKVLNFHLKIHLNVHT